MKIVFGITKKDIRLEPDGDMWSAYCDKLGLDSFGKTKAEAERNLAFSIALYLKSLIEKDIIWERMKEQGVKMQLLPEIEDFPFRPLVHKGQSKLSPMPVG